LNADESAGVTGAKSGGGCVGKLGLTTDTSAARAKPGKAAATMAIIVRSLRISSSPSRSRKPATGAAVKPTGGASTSRADRAGTIVALFSRRSASYVLRNSIRVAGPQD
jgi:hypothetical protein